MTFSFSLATPADAEEIVALVNLAYVVEDFFKIGPRTDMEEVGEIIANDAFIITRDEAGGLVGCVEVHAREGRGYFGMLSVDPGQQKTGLGAQLIAAAERWAAGQGCTVMDLWYVNVREELPAYYARHGYVETGTEPWPWQEKTQIPVHFVVMSKPLIPSEARLDA